MPGSSFEPVLVINPVALQEFMISPAGPVFRHMIELGEKVKQEAIAEAPVGTPDPLGRPKADGTQIGNLRDHIVKRVEHGEGGNVRVLVGVWNVPYAFGVHEGNPAHTIKAKNKPLLVFDWDGQTISKLEVHHPGNQPNRFLVRALRAIH